MCNLYNPVRSQTPEALKPHAIRNCLHAAAGHEEPHVALHSGLVGVWAGLAAGLLGTFEGNLLAV